MAVSSCVPVEKNSLRKVEKFTSEPLGRRTEFVSSLIGYISEDSLGTSKHQDGSILYEENVRFGGSSAVFSAIYPTADERVALRTLRATANAKADFEQLHSISFLSMVPRRYNGSGPFESNSIRFSMAMTPLHYAAFCGFDDVVSFLLEKVPCVDTIIEERLRTSLLAAIYGGNSQTAIMLMGRGASPMIYGSGSGITALHLAAAANLPNILTYLVRMVGMNINVEDAQGDTPLVYTLVSPKTTNESIAHLVSLGANIDKTTTNRRGYISPLGIACHLSEWDFAEMLLDSGANPGRKQHDKVPGQSIDNSSMQPLRYALLAGPQKLPEIVAHNRKRVIAKLLDSGADLNEEVYLPSYGTGHGTVHRTSSLLHEMLDMRLEQEVKLLIQSKNININQRDYKGITALDYALSTQDGQPHMATLLLRHGAEISIQSVEATINLMKHIWQTPNAMNIIRTLSDHPKLARQLHVLFNECSGRTDRITKALGNCPVVFINLIKDKNKARRLLTNQAVLEAMKSQFEITKKRKAAPTPKMWWKSNPVKRSRV